MKAIVGYSEPLSAAPGATVRFMVSCAPELTWFEAGIVRMICGDAQPGAPGLRQHAVPSAVDATYRARHQPIRPGSFVRVSGSPVFGTLRSLTIRLDIQPTLLSRPRQTLMSKFDAASRSGFELSIEDRRLCLCLGDGVTVENLRADLPLREGWWCAVTASFDHATGRVRLAQRELPRGFDLLQSAGVERRTAVTGVAACTHDLLIAASPGEGSWAVDCFDGRMERPIIARAVLDEAMLAAAHDDVIAAWDFSRDISTSRVFDGSPHGNHGIAVNLPIRAVRGAGWSGAEQCWRHAPSEYAAMHFLSDAIDDCGWDPDFTFTVPDDLPSGFYAAFLRSGEQTDHIPFFVRPRPGTATAGLALLVPTFSYLAYANWRVPFENTASELMMNALPVLGEEDQYLLAHPELGPSLYDAHDDGTSAFYASPRKPNLNMRPAHPWLEQYPADLFLVNWLHDRGIACDVLTDDDLHAEGETLLARYRCVMTGSHPEYYSTPMLDALEAYLHHGGRLMYLGGNGFVWRVGAHPDRAGVIELRRAEAGSSIGSNAPGEFYMSTTGEYGGPWSKIGRPPQRLVGVGFIAQGFDFSAGYTRLADAADPRASFVFAGVDESVVGAFGLQGHGAAGVEIDRTDPALGTPHHTLRLATSAGLHTAAYRLGNFAGLDVPEVRADLVLFETGQGGAVFSVGSMAWAAALPHAGGENAVSRITHNVLARFLDPTPFDSAAK